MVASACVSRRTLPRADWRLTDGFGAEWHIFLVPPEERLRRTAPDAHARGALAQLVYTAFDHSGATEDSIARVLLEVYDSLTNGCLASQLPRPRNDPQRLLRDFDLRIRDALLDALWADEIRVEPVAQAPWPFDDRAFAEPAPALGPEPEPEPTAWIAIELADDDGNAVHDVEYRIVCDDGRVRSGRTNRAGKAREEHLHAGNCKVTFPDLYGPDWRKVE